MTGGPYTSVWQNAADAFFEGTAGTVNVTGTINSVNSITFSTDGYTLGSSGTITLTAPAATSPPALARTRSAPSSPARWALPSWGLEHSF